MKDIKVWNNKLILVFRLILTLRIKEINRRLQVSIIKSTFKRLQHFNVDPLQVLKDYLVEQNFDSNVTPITKGLFKGLVLETDSWSRGDLVAIASGKYEAEVLKWLSQKGPFEIVVNVGAGTGYYALGLLHANFGKRAILFEINADSREIARANSARNGLENLCTFYGAATESNLLSIQPVASSLLITDIEGGEFGILTDDVLNKFSSCHLVIEIHDFTDQQKLEYQRLIDRCKDKFDIEIINQSERNPHDIEEILHLGENSRWLLMSEGRPSPMKWLALSPRTLVVNMDPSHSISSSRHLR